MNTVPFPEPINVLSERNLHLHRCYQAKAGIDYSCSYFKFVRSRSGGKTSGTTTNDDEFGLFLDLTLSFLPFKESFVDISIQQLSMACNQCFLWQSKKRSYRNILHATVKTHRNLTLFKIDVNCHNALYFRRG